MGALLDLHIGFGYVLSHDTQAEKLQAADEDDDTDGGSPAWDRIIKDQLSDDDGYQDQKGKTGHGRSEPGGDGQRYLREIDDAADCVFKQLVAKFWGHDDLLGSVGRHLVSPATRSIFL